MATHIKIPYSINTKESTLPLSTSQSIDVISKPESAEITVMVSDFPDFIKPLLELNLMFVKASVQLNMVSQQLVKDVDPFLVADIDDMSLGDLDIGQDEIFYSK